MAQKTVKDRGLTRAEIERETKKLASDLAFHARAPVSIQLVGGDHIAYTYGTDEEKKKHQIPIVMNPDTLKEVRNKEQAIKIWRGIGYHELAHHLFPAGSQYKIAHKEGFRHLFNLVDDEQNERLGRSMDASWGACFQAVCAHVFSLKKLDNETLSPGIVDGGKSGKKPRGIAANKIYIERWNQFAVHLRRHLPDPADPVVAEALALIPEDFKDLPKEKLLALTRKIHEVLSRGIEIGPDQLEGKPGKPGDKPGDPQGEDESDEDEPDEDETPKEDEKKEDEKKEDEPEEEEEEEKEEEPEPLVKGTWALSRLLHSKWLYIAFVLFILGWAAVFVQGRTTMWVRLAVQLVIALTVVTGFLFLRRAYVKKVVKDIQEKIKAIRSGASSRSGSSASSSKKSIDFKLPSLKVMLIGTLTSGALGFGLWWLWKHRFGAGGSLKAIEELAAAVLIWVLIGAYFFYKMYRKQDRDDNKPLSKPALVVMVAAALASLGLTIYALSSLGMRMLFLAPLVGVLTFGLFFLVLMCVFKFGERRENAWSRLKRSMRERWDDVWEKIVVFFCWIGRGLKSLGRWIAIGALWVWGKLVIAAKFVAKWSTRLWWYCQPTALKLWRNPITRLFILALPLGLLIVMLRAVFYTAGKTSIWLAIILILLILALLILGFIFRKKIKKFVMTEMFMPMPSLMDVAIQGGLNMETEWFVQVDDIVPIQPNQEVLDRLQPKIYAVAQQLRPYLKKCGRQTIDREDQPEGYDLTDEAELALVGETSIFIDDDIVPRSSLHIEVALDCSSSMASPTQSLKPGEKFLVGQFFQLVVEQACLNLPGVSAHFWGFTGNQIYDCGVPGEGRSSGLVCGGGNNDAAMLWHMGQSAANSGKDVKILMMLSDGQPSECSWLSLKNLVLQFEQAGMIPWNFALDVIEIPAFERFFTDLVGQSMEQAIITMGETLAAIAEECN